MMGYCWRKIPSNRASDEQKMDEIEAGVRLAFGCGVSWASPKGSK